MDQVIFVGVQLVISSVLKVFPNNHNEILLNKAVLLYLISILDTCFFWIRLLMCLVFAILNKGHKILLSGSLE